MFSLFALKPDGTQKWVFTTGGWILSSPVIGVAVYLKLNRARELKSLRKRAKLLGFELVDRSSGEVLLNPVS